MRDAACPISTRGGGAGLRREGRVARGGLGRVEGARRGQRVGAACETCPLSTGGRTRRVQLVRGGGPAARRTRSAPVDGARAGQRARRAHRGASPAVAASRSRHQPQPPREFPSAARSARPRAPARAPLSAARSACSQRIAGRTRSPKAPRSPLRTRRRATQPDARRVQLREVGPRGRLGRTRLEAPRCRAFAGRRHNLGVHHPAVGSPGVRGRNPGGSERVCARGRPGTGHVGRRTPLLVLLRIVAESLGVRNLFRRLRATEGTQGVKLGAQGGNTPRGIHLQADDSPTSRAQRASTGRRRPGRRPVKFESSNWRLPVRL